MPHGAVDRRKPASLGKLAIPPSESESLWEAFMTEFEDAGHEVLAKLHPP